MNCWLMALAMSLKLMCLCVLECYEVVVDLVVVCRLDRVLCFSRCLCFVCGPMVFLCVPLDLCLDCAYEGGDLLV